MAATAHGGRLPCPAHRHHHHHHLPPRAHHGTRHAGARTCIYNTHHRDFANTGLHHRQDRYHIAASGMFSVFQFSNAPVAAWVT